MRTSRYISVAVTLLAVVLGSLEGCSRDPKIRRDKFLQSAQHYFDNGDYQAASIQLRRAIQLDPKCVDAHYQLALAYLRLHQWQAAYDSLQKAIEIDAYHVPTRLELARFEFAARQTAKARQELDVILAKEPNNLNAHLLLGQIALSEKDYKQALKEFEIAEQVAPTNPTPFTEAGDTYVLLKQYPDAVQSLLRAIEIDKSYGPAYLNLAQAFRLEGDTQSEIATLQNAIRANPKQIGPYLAEAAAYVRQGKSGEVSNLFPLLRSATADNSAALLAIGEFYFSIGDAQQARTVFHEALVKDGKNDTIRKRLIELDLNQHEWDEAEMLNEQLLKAQPKDPMGRLFEARLQFVRGTQAKAVTSLENLVHDNPDLALPRFYLGLAYATEGEGSRAISSLNDTVQQDPNFIWAYIGLAELYAEQGSPKLALEFADRALTLTPNFVPAILLQANSYMQLGDYSMAVAKLQATQAVQPKNATVAERLAVVSINQKQYPRAEQQLETALRLQPDYLPAMLDLLQLYALEKRSTDQIIGRIEQQIAVAPKQSNFYEMLGEAYVAKHELAKGQQAFEDALRINPNATQAQLQLARLYASEGKLQEAIQTSQTLRNAHLDFLPAYMMLGSLYEQAGDVQKAEQQYEQAVQRKQDFAPALNNLAWLYCENGGNLDLALSLAERAKAKLPTEPSVSDTLAWIQYRKGLYSSAVDLLEDVTRQSPQNPTYQYHLGMALWKAGKPADAKFSLRRALDLHLGAKPAQEATNVLAELKTAL